MNISILGTGSCLPEKIYDNAYMESIVETNDEWIVERTGIRRRHILEGRLVEMAAQAGRRALDAAGVAPEEIGGVIVATITGDAIVPSTACGVLTELGICCPAFDINAACTGFLYALAAAEPFAAGGKPVLIIGAESLSKITDYTDRGTCVLFGDGAGAAVVARGEGMRYMDFNAYGDPEGALYVPNIDKTAGPEKQYIHMNGQAVFKFATRELVMLAERAFAALGIAAEEIDLVIPHQANLRIISYAARKLGMPMEKFFVNVQELGNTSAASVPIALDEAIRTGAAKKGDTVMLLGFGGGLTSGVAVLTL